MKTNEKLNTILDAIVLVGLSSSRNYVSLRASILSDGKYDVKKILERQAKNYVCSELLDDDSDLVVALCDIIPEAVDALVLDSPAEVIDYLKTLYRKISAEPYEFRANDYFIDKGYASHKLIALINRCHGDAAPGDQHEAIKTWLRRDRNTTVSIVHVEAIGSYKAYQNGDFITSIDAPNMAHATDKALCLVVDWLITCDEDAAKQPDS